MSRFIQSRLLVKAAVCVLNVFGSVIDGLNPARVPL